MLKSFVTLLAAVAFVGCSSSPKNSTSSASSETAAKAEAKTETAKVEKEVKGKKDKKMKPATTETTASAGAVSCVNGSDKRALEVKTAGKGCELHYTKAENTSTIATQVEGDKKCTEVLERIKGKLEGSGFTCS